MAAYFRLFPLEWLGQVRMLTPEETGVYFTLTLMMLERESPLPIDIRRTARALRISPKSLTTTLEDLVEQGLIWEAEDGFMSDFVQQELQRTEEIREKNSRAANKRWAKKSIKTVGDRSERNAGAMRAQSHTSPVQSSAEPALQAGVLPSASSTSMHSGENGRRAPDGAPPVNTEMRRGDDILVVNGYSENRVLVRNMSTGGTEALTVQRCIDLMDDIDDDIPF